MPGPTIRPPARRRHRRFGRARARRAAGHQRPRIRLRLGRPLRGALRRIARTAGLDRRGRLRRAARDAARAGAGVGLL